MPFPILCQLPPCKFCSKLMFSTKAFSNSSSSKHSIVVLSVSSIVSTVPVCLGMFYVCLIHSKTSVNGLAWVLIVPLH